MRSSNQAMATDSVRHHSAATAPRAPFSLLMLLRLEGLVAAAVYRSALRAHRRKLVAVCGAVAAARSLHARLSCRSLLGRALSTTPSIPMWCRERWVCRALLLHAHGLLPYALIWANHIGVDRLLGYGLKYRAGFGWTHLGSMGRRPQANLRPDPAFACPRRINARTTMRHTKADQNSLKHQHVVVAPRQTRQRDEHADGIQFRENAVIQCGLLPAAGRPARRRGTSRGTARRYSDRARPVPQEMPLRPESAEAKRP